MKAKRSTCAIRAATVTVAALAVACTSTAGDARTDVEVAANSGALSVTFGRAAEHTGVPRDLLVAIARVEDGLELPAQRLVLEADNAVPAAGPLMLRRGKLDTLARAAVLSGKSELELRRDSDLALDAGARVLAELGTKTGARAEDLASWKGALEEMSGYADQAHREEYAHRVFATLARGGALAGRDGERLTLDRHDLPPALTLDLSQSLHALTVAQMPGAEWIPTSCVNKCHAGRGGAKVEYIVIHDTEGGWDASVSTLQNDPDKSVHYIVGTDGRIAQFVTEDTTAWHAGNYYFNQRSVGIEHVGYASKPYTEAEYAASAKLVDYLAKKYAVAPDRAHVIGHEQVPNNTRISESAAPCANAPVSCESNLDYGGAGHHTDPGVWEWATYMPRFAGSAKCNDVTDLWNCSYDKKKAFRCAADKVTVETCDGAGACEVKPIGQDDLCHVSAKSPGTPGTSGSTDPGASTGDAGTSGGTATTSGDPSSALAASDESARCSVSRGVQSKRAGRSALGLALLALAAVLARRTRRGEGARRRSRARGGSTCAVRCAGRAPPTAPLTRSPRHSPPSAAPDARATARSGSWTEAREGPSAMPTRSPRGASTLLRSAS